MNVTQFFFDLLRAAEFQHGAPSRLLRRHPRGKVGFGEFFNMKAQFGIKLPPRGTLGKKEFPPRHRALLIRSLENLRHRAGQPIPIRFLAGQLLAALRRQLIELRLSPVARLAPLRFEPAALLQAVQRGIERALLDLQNFLGNLPDSLGDAVPVNRTKRDNLQDQQVQCSLQEIRLFDGHTFS